MSRDPDDHSPTDPNELHKYLYAGGDPIDRLDPTGRGDSAEYLKFAVGFGLVAYAAVKTYQCYNEIYTSVRSALNDAFNSNQHYYTNWGEVLACLKDLPWDAMSPPGAPNPAK